MHTKTEWLAPNNTVEDTLHRAESIESLAASLVAYFEKFESCAVAFSGGVDSSVVAKGAYLALGNRAFAVTGCGPAVSQTDLEWVDAIAQSIGIGHAKIATMEIQDENYLRNDANRCFHCKSNLYTQLRSWADQHGVAVIASGTNQDDLADYRPGLRAGANAGVLTPLADLKFTKRIVRSLAAYWDLAVGDRPASPCLASRIAYGESVSSEKLKRIESAEHWLVDQGFTDVRVRLHPGNLARIELQSKDFSRVLDMSMVEKIQKAFIAFGFQFVTLDLCGRRSGSLNQLLPILDSNGAG